MQSTRSYPRRGVERNVFWIITVSALTITLWGNWIGNVNGAPAKLDVTPSSLELQLPLVDSAAAATNVDKDVSSAVDSYGNPIESLKPIETPDGRKVVSAQGLQFEIPNYASGITEIKKPADDLLPPFIDPITSSEVEASQGAPKFINPFLPSRNSGQYKPPTFSENSGKAAPSTTTTTTTTSTTTPATPVENNPFDSKTLPPWLKDFDYPEIGPGVPFVYDPEDTESAVSNNLLPPSKLETQTTGTTQPVFVTSSPASFNSFKSPFQATSAASSPSVPSKFTPSYTSEQSEQSEQSGLNKNAVTLPPLVFIPPPAAEDPSTDSGTNVNNQRTDPKANPSAVQANRLSSPSFNQNFAAPFEPIAAAEATKPTGTNQPVNTDGSTAFAVPTKTTFSKSDDGKVITNNVFLQGATSGQQPAAKPVGFGNSFSSQNKDFPTSQTNSFFSSANSFSATSSNNVHSTTGFGSNLNKASTPTSFSVTSGSVHQAHSSSGSGTASGGGKYTGGFGGAPGVLGGGKVGFAVQSQTEVNKNQRPQSTSSGSFTVAPAFGDASFANRFGGTTASHTKSDDKFRGSFGGPPGVLVPYDNVKGGRL